MREATNQHNIFIRTLICRFCAHAGAHSKFKRHQPIAFTRARQTKSGRIENRAMRRADQRVARSVQKPVRKCFKRQAQMRAPVYKSAKTIARMPDDEVKLIAAVRVLQHEAACFLRRYDIGRANYRAAGG